MFRNFIDFKFIKTFSFDITHIQVSYVRFYDLNLLRYHSSVATDARRVITVYMQLWEVWIQLNASQYKA